MENIEQSRDYALMRFCEDTGEWEVDQRDFPTQKIADLYLGQIRRCEANSGQSRGQYAVIPQHQIDERG